MTEPKKTAPKPKRETWLDWIAPVPYAEAMLRAQPMLKTDELLASLKSQSIEATRRDISFWQRQGVIPYPTKERRDGAVWAMYPHWMMQVIESLRKMQEHGLSLDQITVMLRGDVSHVFGRELEGEARTSLDERIANMEYRAALEKAIPFLQEAADAFERMESIPIQAFDINLRKVSDDLLEDWKGGTRCRTVDIFNPAKFKEDNVMWRLKDCS